MEGLYIRIRDNLSGLRFIPKFEIKQRYTGSNVNIMELICKFLQSKGIQANLRSNAQYVLCVILNTLISEFKMPSDLLKNYYGK